MSLLSFNPFKYAERLEKTGLDPETAKEIATAQMEVLRSLMEEKLVAKEDLTKLATKEDLKDLRSEMKWMFGATIAILTLVMSVFKFLH